jgi:hypothetical protein
MRRFAVKTQYKTGRAAPFVQVPVELLSDPNCDCHTIATYVALRSFCDFGSEAGAYPSDTAAAARAGMGRRTFIDRRQRLRDMGWVEWDSGKENGKTNSYTIHAVLEEGGVQEPHRGCAGDAHPGMQEMHTTYIQDTIDSIPKKHAKVFQKHAAAVNRLWPALSARGVRPRSQAVTWRRIKGLVAALELYTEDECRDVIHGCLHREHNIAGGYLDLELMFRDQAHIEMYLHQWRSNGSNGGPNTTETRRALEAMYESVG